ncbi:hypothetical protein AVEN_12278-1 [Araneus ventricosus]|uniref:Uncharacterized protein n=1 Tax=Araneus ventricosus TaxID=182803 RepID=A0A4Y2HCJ3_ARAVE|nr:hypothetical protein AVEN_12278-1 [Araneus ventricosus]
MFNLLEIKLKHHSLGLGVKGGDSERITPGLHQDRYQGLQHPETPIAFLVGLLGRRCRRDPNTIPRCLVSEKLLQDFTSLSEIDNTAKYIRFLLIYARDKENDICL